MASIVRLGWLEAHQSCKDFLGLGRSCQHSDSNCSNRMFVNLGCSKHSLELYFPASLIMTTSQCSFSSYFAQSSFGDSVQQICFKHPMNVKRMFSYQVCQIGATATKLYMYWIDRFHLWHLPFFADWSTDVSSSCQWINDFEEVVYLGTTFA